jgi:hypothetical protein
MDTPEIKIEWEKYSHLFKEIEIPAKAGLLNEGKVSKYGYFIKKGCLRLWFNNKGKDVTFQFFSYIKNTPEERYKELLKTNPHIIKRIPQHYIASYLGITSVSLSRIRNRV